MKAPRFPAPEDSLAAVAASNPAQGQIDAILAVDEANTRLIDAEWTLRLIGDAVFNLSGSSKDAGKCFSAIEVLVRELGAIGEGLSAALSALNEREKELAI